MARKELTVTITDAGRDLGKAFLLREMSASQAEWWAMRAMMALAKSGVEIPDDIASAGLAGVASMGIKAFGGMNYLDAAELMYEMMQCVSVIPDPSRPQVIRGLIEDDIEEVKTRLKLRMELFTLHTGFSLPGAPSISAPAQATGGNTPSTKTSRAQ